MNLTPAASITKDASKQTYYTIRYLVDRDRVEDAYRAYGYFRWVDDVLDEAPSTWGGWSEAISAARKSFLQRQKSILEICLRGETPQDVNSREKMLVELVQSSHGEHHGLHAYLRNMMCVMDFDEKRRGTLVSQVELNEYTSWLATAVTECMHFFIGSDAYSPKDETRHLAVSAAHIIHMLRDTFIDAKAGYFNVPREVLETNLIKPLDVSSRAYRAWVRERVGLAREYFDAGKRYYRRVQCRRLRLAAFAYIARFEWLLATLERENFTLRPNYSDRKSLGAGLRMGMLALSSLMSSG